MTDGLHSPIAPIEQMDTSERRLSTRQTTVFQVARIIVGAREELCILRNVSPGGLKAELYMTIAPGTAVTIELKTGYRLQGHVVWGREPFVGVQFDDSVPIMEMLGRCAPDVPFQRARPPRIETDLPSILRIDRVETPTRITNVSQLGLKLGAATPLATDLRCEVHLPELGWRRACVRWWYGGEAGLMLVQPLLYPEFAAWRRTLWESGAGR